MAPPATDVERLTNAFEYSWISSPPCVEFLEDAIVRRQNEVVLGRTDIDDDTPGWRRDHGAIRLAALVDMVAVQFGARTPTTPGAFLAISLGSALIGELLITVRSDQPGAILTITEDANSTRGSKQLPFVPLRNTLCHPGYLPERPGAADGRGAFDALVQMIARRYRDQSALVQALEQDRTAVASLQLARWAFDRAHELGQFEIVQMVLDGLRCRKIEVTPEDERRVEKECRMRPELEMLVGKARKKPRSVGALLGRKSW